MADQIEALRKTLELVALSSDLLAKLRAQLSDLCDTLVLPVSPSGEKPDFSNTTSPMPNNTTTAVESTTFSKPAVSPTEKQAEIAKQDMVVSEAVKLGGTVVSVADGIPVHLTNNNPGGLYAMCAKHLKVLTNPKANLMPDKVLAELGLKNVSELGDCEARWQTILKNRKLL